MQISHEHNLGREEAYQRVNNLVTSLKEKYQGKLNIPEMDWNEARDQMSFVLRARGVGIRGQVYLTDEEVRIEAKLPFIARAFEGTIETVLKTELESLLD